MCKSVVVWDSRQVLVASSSASRPLHSQLTSTSSVITSSSNNHAAMLSSSSSPRLNTAAAETGEKLEYTSCKPDRPTRTCCCVVVSVFVKLSCAQNAFFKNIAKEQEFFNFEIVYQSCTFFEDAHARILEKCIGKWQQWSVGMQRVFLWQICERYLIFKLNKLTAKNDVNRVCSRKQCRSISNWWRWR